MCIFKKNHGTSLDLPTYDKARTNRGGGSRCTNSEIVNIVHRPVYSLGRFCLYAFINHDS